MSTLDAKLRAFAATGRLVADEPTIAEAQHEVLALFLRSVREVAKAEALTIKDHLMIMRTCAPLVAAQPERAREPEHARTYSDVLAACVTAIGRTN